MRIGILAPAPFMGTGYAVQAGHLALLLREQGHTVGLFCFAGIDMPMAWNGIQIYPKLMDEFGQDMAIHAQAFNADVVIPILDLWPMQLPNWEGVRLAPWFPVDHEPLSPVVAEKIPQVFQPIVYSQHGQSLCRAAGLNVAQIPCMVDTEIYQPTDRTEARAALGWPQDRFIVGMVAANVGNPSRKAFYQQLRAFALFHQEHPDTVLYLHTLLTAPDGEYLPGMLRGLGLEIGRDVLVANQYQYMLRFPAAHLASAYNGMDVLLACATGEGFCVPLIEAQVCGTPVITGAWTSMPELCFAGWTVERATAEVYGKLITDDDYWGNLQACKVIPRPSAIVEKLEAAYQAAHDPTRAEWLRERGRAAALAYDVRAVAESHWRPMLAELEGRL